MKNVVSTIVVFGSIFILIVAGAFVFDKFNGFGLIDNMDTSLNQGIKNVLENDNKPIDNHAENENISDSKSLDNNTQNTGNGADTSHDISDNESISNDNNSLDNNSLSDNSSDKVSI